MIEVVRTLPVSLAHCDVNPATPWVMALRLTRVATTGASERVPDSLLHERRVEIHRDAANIHPSNTNPRTTKTAGQDTKIDVALVATAETDSRIILEDAHLRGGNLGCRPIRNYYFDVVCDTDSIIGSVSVIEGPGAKAEVNLKVDYPPEYDISILVVTLDEQCERGHTTTRAALTLLNLMFEGGNDTAKTICAVSERRRARRHRNVLYQVVQERIGRPRQGTRRVLNEDGDVVETSGASLTVTIIDDDTAIMDLGPEVRNVWAGDPIPISGRWDTESTECIVRFSLFMNANASGALENVLSEETVSNRWSHCSLRDKPVQLRDPGRRLQR